MNAHLVGSKQNKVLQYYANSLDNMRKQQGFLGLAMKIYFNSFFYMAHTKAFIKGVEKKTSPFDTFIILVKFEVLQRIFEFGPKKES